MLALASLGTILMLRWTILDFVGIIRFSTSFILFMGKGEKLLADLLLFALLMFHGLRKMDKRRW